MFIFCFCWWCDCYCFCLVCDFYFIGGNIKIIYADGTTQQKQITSNMVRESNGSQVNMAPTASDYINNEISKTLVIKYKEDNATVSVFPAFLVTLIVPPAKLYVVSPMLYVLLVGSVDIDI